MNACYYFDDDWGCCLALSLSALVMGSRPGYRLQMAKVKAKFHVVSCVFEANLDECNFYYNHEFCNCRVCLKCAHACASCDHLSWRNAGRNLEIRRETVFHLKE